jgi:tetratricopeptide (TPR) repeat protein
MGVASDSTHDGTSHARVWLLIALAGVGLAHSSALDGGFVWDDHHLIEGQAGFEEFQGPAAYFLRPFWNHPEFGGTNPPFYRPLVTLSYALDHWLWRGDATGFHRSNLLLHLAVCALVFALCRKGRVEPRLSALATLLFGTFPRLTESVSWISGRTDLLAAIGALSSLLIYSSRPSDHVRRLAAGLALALGLCAKEVALAALCALAVLELTRVHRREASTPEALRNLAPVVAGAAAYLGLRLVAFAGGDAGVTQLGIAADFGPLQRFVILPLETLGTFAHMVTDPLHPAARIGHIGSIDWGIVGFGLLAGTAGLVLLRRGLGQPWPPACFAALGLAGAALLPVLNWGRPLQAVVASDRFLYLPMAGVALAIALRYRSLSARTWRVTTAVVAVVALVFGLATHRRAELWTSDLSLWQADAPRAHPLDPIPHALLANAYGRDHQPEQALRSHERALQIEESLARLFPSYGRNTLIQANYGLALTEVGRVDAAIRHLERLAARQPDIPVVHVALGTAYGRRLDLDRAREELETALRLQPGYARAQRALAQTREATSLLLALPPASASSPTVEMAQRARAFALLGRNREAAELFDRVAARSDSSTADLHRAALFLVMRGEPDAAMRAVTLLAERGDSPAQTTQILRHQLAGRQAR